MDHEAEPPPESSFAQILDNAQQVLRQQLTEEVQERETRLLGLLNSIGHPSLESLEDFIYIHGASKLVPLSTLPTAMAGPVQGESQTQFPLSPSKRDQRHRDRKVELTALRQEVTSIRAELQYAQMCLKKETAANERTTRDLDRLLNVAMESQGLRTKGGDSEGVAELHSSLQAAYDEIESMDAAQRELEEQLVAQTSELEELRARAEAALEGREEAVKREAESIAALDKLKDTCRDLERQLDQLKAGVSATSGQGATCSAASSHISPAPPRGPPPPTSPRSAPQSVHAAPSSLHQSIQTASQPSKTQIEPASPPSAIAEASSAPKLSVPVPLRRHNSSTAQLSLYEPLRLKYLKTLTSVMKNQAWHSNNWEAFVRANSIYFAKMDPISAAPEPFATEQKEYPSLDQLEQAQVGEVYRELEQAEKNLSVRLAEWLAWKTQALACHEEIKQMAREAEERIRAGVGTGQAVVEGLGGQGQREGTPVKVAIKKLRRVPGTGGRVREIIRDGRGQDSIDTPTRSSFASPSTSQAPPQDAQLSRAPLSSEKAQQAAAPELVPAARAATPEPKPHVPTSAPLPSSAAGPVSPAVSPPCSLPSASALDASVTPLVLTQTPRKTKRRSDILHLSASGQPTVSGVMSTVRKGPPLGGQLLRDALIAAREEDDEGAIKPLTFPQGAVAEQLGDFEDGEDVFAAPAPRTAQRGRSVSFRQPESSWEQDPDTQSSGVDVLENDDGIDQVVGSGRAKVLVPPSSAEESLSPNKTSAVPICTQPPLSRHAPSFTRPTSHSPARTTLSGSSPRPHPAPRLESPPVRRPPAFDTQDLISAAEQEDEDPTARPPQQAMSMPPSAQPRTQIMVPPLGTNLHHALTSVSEPTSLVREKKREHRLPAEPATTVKAEPDASPPRIALALRNLGSAFGSPPAPAANWAAIERGEKSSKRARDAEPNKEKKSKRRKKAPERTEEDVKPDISDSRQRRPSAETEDEGTSSSGEAGRKLRPLDDTNFSDLDMSPGGEDDPEGHHWMRRLHAKRKLEVEKLRQQKAQKSAPVKLAIEINPARNGGKSYHFKEVVRNKEARKHMHAHTCEGCAGYYEADQRSFDHAAKCKGSGKGQGKGKARGPAPKGNHFLDERHRQMEARLQKTSRHRAQHKPDPEPPDFWQMGFPDTQRVEEINRRAEKDREEKRLYQEAQAQTDGFYRYRK